MPQTYADAATRAAGLTSAEDCGAAIEKSASLFRKAMDPDNGFSLTLPQAEAVDRMLIDHGHEPAFLSVFAARVGRGIHTQGDLADRMLTVAKLTGDLCGEARAARDPLSPGGKRLVASERATIAGRAQEAIDELTKLIRDMESEEEPALRRVS